MPKPTTKEELLKDIQTQRASLEDFLASLTPEQMAQPEAVARWSVKDVLAHLAEWEQIFLGWYAAGLRGENPPLPAQGYTWGRLPALNLQIYQKHREKPLEEVMDYFHSSYRQVWETVLSISEDDLFTPGRYAWTGKNALAAYIIPCTGEHYHWARRELRKGMKRNENYGMARSD